MAIITNTVQTFQQVGIREDLSDVIINISPTDTPFFSMCRKGKANNRNPEWLRDTLRKPSPTNAVIEGNDSPTAIAAGQPERLKNYVQLFDETVIVSDTAQVVDTAGRSNELKYQVAKSAKALKRDIEQRIAGNYSFATGNTSTAGQTGGAEAWIVSNVSLGATGAVGTYSGGPILTTDGTARAFTEAQLKAVIKAAWDAGGEPDTIMVTGKQKQAFSAFGGIATQFNQVNDQNKVMIYGAADIYKSDFGTHKVVPNRFLGAGTGRTADSTSGLFTGQTALVLTPSTWEVKMLQPFQTLPLARTGHAEKRLLKTELTLACKEERANGKVADLS